MQILGRSMEVKGAIEKFDLEHIVPFFQPVMDLQQNAVASYECLARLVDENDHTFLPSDFLVIIERDQCEGALTDIMLTRSSVYFRELNVPWSVNISLRDMVDPEFSKRLSALVQDYPHPERITLEVTAENAMQYPNEFKNFLLLCKAVEVSVSIDNFGASAEDVSRLLPMPIDGIKLAGALVNAAVDSAEVRDYIRGVNELAKDNGVFVIAEHIEDEKTLAVIKDLGVRYGQGFYFSYPQSKLN